MPATLDQAFRSPINNIRQSYGSASSSGSMDSLRNPDYYNFQRNYRIKKVSDIETEADELKSMYDEPNKEEVSVNTKTASCNEHDCNYLIAKLLSCSHCRNRLKELLCDSDEKKTVTSEGQVGGDGQGAAEGSYFGINFGQFNNFGDIISNVILGIILLVILDRVIASLNL